MRLVVTFVIRHVDARSKSGFLSIVDWPSGRLVARLPVPESMHRMTDPNPRGGTRGVRGVSALRDKLLVANADKVFVVDRNWKAVSEVTHPFLGGVHDILAEPDSFWACCTSADLLVKFSWKGDALAEWDCRGDSELKARLVYNDSNASCVVQLRLDQSMDPRRVVIPGEPPFVRGLMRLDARRFLVGSQAPAAIYEVDCDSCTVARRVPLGGAPGESVYGISSLPDAFDDPPDRIWPAS